MKSAATGGHRAVLDRIYAAAAGLALFALACPNPGAAAGSAAVEPLPVEAVAPGVYVYEGPYELISPANRGAIANVGFVVGSQAVAVIDTGGSPAVGAALKAAIVARTSLPIRYVVNTHVHPDHVLGNAAFRGEGVTFVGHRKLARALAARGAFYLAQADRQLAPEDARGIALVPPDVAVDDTLRLDLGGRTLLLEAHPTAHTDADLTVLDEQTGTWFLGDLLFVGHLPTIDGSIRGWLAEMARLRERPVARVVPGHGPRTLPWPEALAPQMRYLGRVADGVRREIAAGRSISEAAEEVGLEERDAWALFDEFNPRNVTAAYKELEWE
jgi:quinoprotein relay system zinc metallohydrolase 2